MRLGLIRRLEKAAPLLLKTSFLFDWLGSANSAFHMELSGKGKDGSDKTINFELIAHSGDGPYIPCIPSLLMAKKLASGKVTATGAQPCVGLITLDEYLERVGGEFVHFLVMVPCNPGRAFSQRLRLLGLGCVLRIGASIMVHRRISLSHVPRRVAYRTAKLALPWEVPPRAEERF